MRRESGSGTARKAAALRAVCFDRRQGESALAAFGSFRRRVSAGALPAAIAAPLFPLPPQGQRGLVAAVRMDRNACGHAWLVEDKMPGGSLGPAEQSLFGGPLPDCLGGLLQPTAGKVFEPPGAQVGVGHRLSPADSQFRLVCSPRIHKGGDCQCAGYARRQRLRPLRLSAQISVGPLLRQRAAGGVATFSLREPCLPQRPRLVGPDCSNTTPTD